MTGGDLWVIASYLLGLCALALFCGAVAGAVGIGGGALLAPGFYALYGVIGAPAETRALAAVGAALGLIALLSAAAVAAQRLAAAPDYALLRRWGALFGVGAALGAAGAALAPGWALTLIIGAAAFGLGLQIAFWPQGEAAPGARRGSKAPPVAAEPRALDLLIGAAGAIGLGAATAVSGQSGGGFSAAALGQGGEDAPKTSVNAAALGVIAGVVGTITLLLMTLFSDRPAAAPWAIGAVDLFAIALAAPLWLLSASHAAQLTAPLPQRPLRLLFAIGLILAGLLLVRAGGGGG
ncbi:MAG: TSUP family transporter [Pseudomonadota bacterium]